MAAGVGTRRCPERFRQSTERADPTSLRGENGSDLAAEADRPVRFELTACANIVKFLRGHRGNRYQPCAQHEQSGSAHGPRGDSGGLPDSSKGEEDFAARRRNEHARPVRSPTEFLREEKPPAGGDYWKRRERGPIVFASLSSRM
jgi:hypothetical protein